MARPDRRPREWGAIRLEARHHGGALVAVWLCTAAAAAPSETAGPSRPPPAEPPRRWLKSALGLAMENLSHTIPCSPGPKLGIEPHVTGGLSHVCVHDNPPQGCEDQHAWVKRCSSFSFRVG